MTSVKLTDTKNTLSGTYSGSRDESVCDWQSRDAASPACEPNVFVKRISR